MISPRASPRLLRLSTLIRQKHAVASTLAFTTSAEKRASNRIYTPVRRPDDFATYVLLSASARAPLLTLWTASYCSLCRQVSPLLNELVSAGVGEAEGGVSLCEVEFDAPDIMSSDLAMTYLITSMPTLLSFDRGEAQLGTKVVDPKRMADREWLADWIRTEARRRGGGGAGGSGGFLGGLFGGGSR